MVEIRALAVDYRVGPSRSPGQGLLRAVDGASALFPSGGISAIVGPSGCGKTSLVHAVAGLLAPSAGEVLIDGEPVRGVRRRTAVIFQDYGLLPWRTVEGNAELPLALAGMDKASRKRRVEPVLDELGLSDFRHFHPGRLSGGMKQRVAIARALAAEPDLLLMDEPFSSLDALTRETAQEFLLEVRRSRKLTILVVTHSIEEAVYLAEAVFVMTGRNPGTISERFDIPENRANLRFARASLDGASLDGASLDGASPQGAPPQGAPPRQDFRAEPRYLQLCASIRSSLRGAGRTDDGSIR